MNRVTSAEIKDFVSNPSFDEQIICKKNKSWPKISIITPSYNQARFLERTILSVLNQNYLNLEYIIIDGGSTDGSLEIIRKYEKYLSYWISEEDNSMYEAINKGLEVASGDILAYLNSDDLYLPGTIQTVVEYFHKHPKAFLVYGDTDYMDAEGNFMYTYRYPAFKYHRFILLNWSSIPQQSSFWRRGIHDEIGYFNTEFKMAGDFEFFGRVGRHYRIDHVKHVLASQRIHAETLSNMRADINKEEVKRIHKYFAVPSGFIGNCQRVIADLRIKVLNLPLMIKKLL